MDLENIDERINISIQNGILNGHRIMFFILGEHAHNKISVFINILSNSRTNEKKLNVLWCYKKGSKPNIRSKKNTKQSAKKNVSHDNDRTITTESLLSYIELSKIQYCDYADCSTVLGKTFDMCILQDFEALTPNILARTIETVKGGGIILFILQKIVSLNQLSTMNMDVHKKFCTESHPRVIGRFNGRLVSSLGAYQNILVLNNRLEILPISLKNIYPIHQQQNQNDYCKNDIETNVDKYPEYARKLIKLCKTQDQLNALLYCIEAAKLNKLNTTISITAARGRGKSSILGLTIASAILFGYCNIYVTAPSPENVITLFEFVLKGLIALEYKENIDYSVTRNNTGFTNTIKQIYVFKNHRQIIKYISPNNYNNFYQTELLVIDEAAAIPLNYIKAMTGNYLMILSTTINGYEGTGRSLTLKLIQQLREQNLICNNIQGEKYKPNSRLLTELTLEEPIRYKSGDEIERWLNELLCLNATTCIQNVSNPPLPKDCTLHYINKKILFSYNQFSEFFLQKLVSLYVSSHYKNSPNDLQTLSDAPAHHLFCLSGSIDNDQQHSPQILVVIQICVEGGLSEKVIKNNFGKGRRSAGDLIPWLMAQLHPGTDFPLLYGARIVRIATNPNFQNMGYASHAINLLKSFFATRAVNLDDDQTIPKNYNMDDVIEPKLSDALLLNLNDCRLKKINYIGVSFGLTEKLFTFWKRSDFVPIYIRSTTNETTGENSCIMISFLENDKHNQLTQFWREFRSEFIVELTTAFKHYSSSLALSLLINNKIAPTRITMNKNELDRILSQNARKRLQLYINNMVDLNLIQNYIPDLAKLYFLYYLGDTNLMVAESAILLGLGLQKKSINDLSEELNLQAPQLFTLLNRAMCKIMHHFEMQF